jgi:hypothetical protein
MSLKLTIKKTPHEKEWAARVTEDGKLVDGPYFANDKKDAEDTGKLMMMRATAGKLPEADLRRHALVSLRNREDCGACFTCICRAILHGRGFTDEQIDPPEPG